MRGERGQTAVEYVALVLVVATMIAAIASLGLDERMRAALDRQICLVINGQTNCALQQAQQAKAAAPD